MKNNVKAKMISDLRDCAREFHDYHSIREMLRNIVADAMGEDWYTDTEHTLKSIETELIKEREKYESQIKAMKCCGNCQHHLLKNVTTRCVECDDFNLWQIK